MTSFLIDTNILVYAHDRSEPEKQKRARDVLLRLSDRPGVFLSTQVLGEFFSVSTRKIPHPLAIEQARQQIDHARRLWPVLPVTEAIVVEAARAVEDNKLNFWDAQLWATAKLNQVATLLSEDFSDGQVIETVSFLNPLPSSFSLDVLS